MLINGIKKTYREMTGKVESVQPVVTVANALPAANESRLGKAEIRARRLRRQRRLARTSGCGFTGWTVRTW